MSYSVQARAVPFRQSMPSSRILWGAFLVAFVTVLLCAGSTRAAERDKVTAFLQVTGFDVAIDSIALSASTAPLMLGLEEDAFGLEWTLLSKKVFDRDLMQTRATDILEATLSDEVLAHGASFYASELGQRLVTVENESHLADDDEKTAEGDRLLKNWGEEGAQREALFNRMHVAIDPQDIGSQAVAEIQVRFILAASYAGVVELRADEDGLRSMLRESAEEFAQEREQSALRNAAFTYQTFSLEELTAYTEALEDPMMMQLYELMNAVHFEVMSNRFEALASAMGQIQPQQEL
ncbi:hypothetical protein shim_08700 [Shimia sp. SK013]|uniref:DUF2059 domain-containing protein n=1 Tax=Shimia sp. SK013 TaxID=1389006 RepID=UPI0006CD6555|nr:DUF2059 domain-containing protein [Shimia sp. SK013]KPA22584.1 hypothetical protein shim_08700 [Shimia sp. SK013]